MIARTWLVPLLVCTLISGCVPVKKLSVRAVTDEEAPLRLGVLPTDQLVGLQKRYMPLVEYLREGLRRPSEMVVSPDYDGLAAMVEQGKADLGWFSGVSYRRARRRHRIVPIARAMLKGDSNYRGVIMVKADGPVRSFQDLKGRRFAYVDRDSGSGFLSPNLTMAREGLDPLRDLKEVVFTHSHFGSLQGVLDGRWDAAAVMENVEVSVQGRLDTTRLRVLVRTDPVPKDILVCSASMAPPLREKVWKLMEALPSSPRGREVLGALQRSNPTDGFVRMEEEK